MVVLVVPILCIRILRASVKQLNEEANGTRERPTMIRLVVCEHFHPVRVSTY